MNPQRKLVLANTYVPVEIQRELDELHAISKITEMVLEELERSDKLLIKSKKISIEARKAGNALYTMKKHDSRVHNDILRQYSKSIAFAPLDSEELVLGFSNRSVLLLHIHCYEESLVDIDRALQLTKDDVFKTKLQARKMKCLQLIDQENLRKSVKNLTLRDDEDLENVASMLKNFKPSVTIPCASDCVGLAYNDTFGRHLVANRDINPGEVLIVEEGYACYPMLNQIYLVCSHCLQFAWNGIPCDDCVFAIYCSESCKNEALNEYHKIECSITKFMSYTVFGNEENVRDRMTTIRLLIKALKKEGYENVIIDIFTGRVKENIDALLSDGILRSDKFKAFYNLTAKDIEAKSEIHELHTSQILYLLIEHTDFLVSLGIGKYSSVFQEHVIMDPYIFLKFKEVLTNLKLIMSNQYYFETNARQCVCNNISECAKNCDSIRGIVIVPCCSLLNHSCTSNVSHLSAPQRKIVVFSTSPIKKGEMLCDSYQGISLLDGDLKARENRLKNLTFTCKCKACLEKIDMSSILDNCEKDMAKILAEFKNIFPSASTNLFCSNPFEKYKTSSLQSVIKISRSFYKHLDYNKAFVHNYECKLYIEQMMFEFYKEKSTVSNDC